MRVPVGAIGAPTGARLNFASAKPVEAVTTTRAPMRVRKGVSNAPSMITP